MNALAQLIFGERRAADHALPAVVGDGRRELGGRPRSPIPARITGTWMPRRSQSGVRRRETSTAIVLPLDLRPDHAEPPRCKRFLY
jgi:hypothetical protein